MEIEVKLEHYRPDALIVHLHGSLDTMTDPAFRQKILDEIDRGVRHLLLQMSGVKYLSSSGLGVIIDLKRKVEERGGALILFESQLSVRRVLEIVKLESWEVTLEQIQPSNPFYAYIKASTEQRQKQQGEADRKKGT